MTAAERLARLPTGAKLLLILTAVLLPIGIALVWFGESGIRQANDALKGRAEDHGPEAVAHGVVPDGRTTGMDLVDHESRSRVRGT